MPIYEFKCRECGEVYEIMMAPGNLPDGIDCDCGGTVQLIVSLFSFTMAEPNAPPKRVSQVNPGARQVRR